MNYQLELKNICKSYGELKANHNVTLKIKPNSIHALLGENGAGKSTLVNIIYGIVSKDSGEIYWEDDNIEISSPNAARKTGIGIVFQHFALFEALTIAENIALGIGYRGNLNKLKQHIIKISAKYQLHIEPEIKIVELSAGQKQRVEIVRCLLQDPKLLILDEPTSVLTPIETEHLFATLRQLQSEGRSILFIGHKLNEIKSICTTATVLRHGEFIGDCELAKMSVAEIAQMMVGSKISEYADKPQDLTPEVLLTASYQSSEHKLNMTNLELKTATIIGIAGIAGNGQDALMSFLAGEVINESASVTFAGQNISTWQVKLRNQAGILFVPTERLGRSAVPQLSLIENTLLGISDQQRFVTKTLINYQKLKQFTSEIIDKFSVKAESNEVQAASLSGGNLQKFIVGRAILQSPKVLLIANPTWGVDISAAIFIRNWLLKLKSAGVAILVASEDLDELFTICDEIAVIKEGVLGEVQNIKDLTLEKVGVLMTE